MATRGLGWTQHNLSRLFTAMKTNIPEHEINVQYRKTLKTLDWKKVSFPPFSPMDCQRKWNEISEKMRKLRSLTDLLDEAEDILSNPKQIHSVFLKKPRSTWNLYFVENHAKLRKQHPTLKPNMLFKLAVSQYKNLPQKEKARYLNKFKHEIQQYKSKISRFRAGPGKINDEPPPAKLVLTGYNVFCKEQFPKMKNGKKGHVFKKMAEQWRKLSTEEKQKYIRKSKALKKQHKTKLEEYQNNVLCGGSKRVIPTSDSEDEDLEDSSSEDEQNYVNFNEDEEEDEDETDEDMEAEDFY